MNFKLNLNEALFDDELDSFLTKDTPTVIDDLDDDFSEYDSSHDVDSVLPGPSQGADTGVANELIALINDEWEAIEGYNNAIATLRANISSNSFYAKAVKVLEEISAEENTHVGQLQEILKQISPNTKEIDAGKKEAKAQLGLVRGLLPVQSWDEVKSSKQNNTQELIDETCTLSDVDDEM